MVCWPFCTRIQHYNYTDLTAIRQCQNLKKQVAIDAANKALNRVKRV